MATAFYTVPLFLVSSLLSLYVSAKVILEDGYTVATVLDGHQRKINPRSVLPLPGSSDLIVLDSAGGVFYSVQFPIAQDGVVKRISGGGDGVAGYSDGDVGSAKFFKPQSFALDLKGNVYVADQIPQNNHVIRKINGAGVTTIAGGLSKKTGRKDGPAQNASFSNNFELTFVAGHCALLVSDIGNQLIRQINLKEVGSKSGLGAVMIWTGGLILSCLLGILIGIVIRTYIIPPEGSSPFRFMETWKHCLISLGKQVMTLCFVIKSAAASNSSSIYTLLRRLWRLSVSHLHLVFTINKVLYQRPHHQSVSLLDLDACSSGELAKSSKYDDQLKDLISFDEHLLGATKNSFKPDGRSAVDNVMQANMGFADAPKDKILQQGSSLCNVALVKRR